VLGPDGRGVVAVLQVDAIVMASVLGLGLPWALFYFSGQSQEPQPELFGVSLLHAAALAIAAVVAAAVLGGPLGRAQGVSSEAGHYLLAAALVPLTFLEYAHVDMLRAQQRVGLANRVLVAGRAAGFVAAIVLVAVLDGGVRLALVALIIASGGQVLGAAPALARRGGAVSRAAFERVLAYGIRIQGASVSRLLSRRFDVVVLSFFASAAVVGRYAVAQSLAELVLLIPLALGLAVGPVIISGQAGIETTHRAIRVTSTAALAVTAALAATAPWSIELAFGSDFDKAVVPLLILLPGVWMFACGEIVSHVLAARGLPGTASLLSILQAALTIALDLVLVPSHGIDGAAVASTIAYTIFGAVSFVVVARHDRVSPFRLLLARPGELRGYARSLRAAVAPG